MRPGPLEIAIIIIVIIAIAVIARIFRYNHGTAKQNEVPSADIHVKPDEERVSSTRNFFRRVGLAFILTGAIILLAGISMFSWALQGYWWSFIIVTIGLALVFLSRKK